MSCDNEDASLASLVISLDLELYWGVSDLAPLERYKQTLLTARETIPRILELFERYALHATWATVGVLFYDQRTDALRDAPTERPTYADMTLSNHERLLSSTGMNEADDPYHFGRSLVKMIAAVPHQEIGTHTFSHYYCLEPGQRVEAFRADLEAAIRAAATVGVSLKSIIFPRHQIVPEYLRVCHALGITTYRGTVPRWPYRPRLEREQTLVLRAGRMADSYVNVTGDHTFPRSAVLEGPLANVRASHYLRPYHPRLRLLESLKQQRIMSAMTHAARRGEICHLWMHPEDFGCYPDQNIRLLRGVAEHFQRLQECYGMRSFTMEEQGEAARATR